MNEVFGYLNGSVHRCGGIVARLMGDGILAFFGAPSSHEDDPQRAVLAGPGILSDIKGVPAGISTRLWAGFQRQGTASTPFLGFGYQPVLNRMGKSCLCDVLPRLRREAGVP